MADMTGKSQNGFTLLEIILAVFIMGIVAAIAIPAFLGFLPGMRLKGASRQVMGDLMDARMEAVKQNNPFRILVLDDHRYKILDDDNHNGSEDTGTETSKTIDIQENYRDVTFNYAGSPPTITFGPKGTATELNTITVRNSSGSKSVSVSVAGRVKIQ